MDRDYPRQLKGNFNLSLPNVLNSVGDTKPIEVLFKHRNKNSQRLIPAKELFLKNNSFVSISDFNFDHLFRTVGIKN